MACVDAHWTSEAWADEVIATMAPRTSMQAPVARVGSLWLSVATKRRGSVLWASTSHVRLSFTDHSASTYTVEQLTRLYSPVL